MIKITRTLTIDAPVERIFSFMDDPCNLPRIWPSMIDTKPTGLSAAGGQNFDWEYKMAGIRMHGASQVLERIPNRHLVTSSQQGIESRFTWHYTPLGDHTRVDLEVEYNIPIPVLGNLAEVVVRKQNEHEADVMLANLKTVMEEQ